MISGANAPWTAAGDLLTPQGQYICQNCASVIETKTGTWPEPAYVVTWTHRLPFCSQKCVTAYGTIMARKAELEAKAKNRPLETVLECRPLTEITGPAELVPAAVPASSGRPLEDVLEVQAQERGPAASAPAGLVPAAHMRIFEDITEMAASCVPRDGTRCKTHHWHLDFPPCPYARARNLVKP